MNDRSAVSSGSAAGDRSAVSSGSAAGRSRPARRASNTQSGSESPLPRVVLVGAMGSGKTTVAGLLAERWGLSVGDTDRDVEATAGKPISEIFVDEGEERFRRLERAAVVEALAGHDGVLALGGGAVLDPDTRADLAGHLVVFLHVGLADAVKRVGLGVGRPLLLGNVRARVKALLDERAPVYGEVATLTVETDGRSPQDVADEVAKAVEEHEAGDAPRRTP